MDNTLVKATKAHLDAYKLAFKKYNLPQKTNKEIYEYLSLASEEFIIKLYPKLSNNKIKEIVKIHNIIFSKKTVKEIKLIKGAKQALVLLCPNYKIAILSNATNKHIEETLRYVEINEQLFDLIIGADQIKKHKPNPEGILKAKGGRILFSKNIPGVKTKDKEYLVEFKSEFSDNPNVHCLSMLEAQGVEFETVCLVGINEQSFSLDGLPQAIIEEIKKVQRDLLYVALTRAMSAFHIMGKTRLKNVLKEALKTDKIYKAND